MAVIYLSVSMFLIVLGQCALVRPCYLFAKGVLNYGKFLCIRCHAHRERVRMARAPCAGHTEIDS